MNIKSSILAALGFTFERRTVVAVADTALETTVCALFPRNQLHAHVSNVFSVVVNWKFVDSLGNHFDFALAQRCIVVIEWLRLI